MEWNYKPLGDRVVVEIVKRHDEKTAGGLYKPSGSDTTMTGKVVAVGNGLFTQTGDKIPMSVKEGDTVFDCFAGSGTTGVVAKRMNRQFILIEKESEYIDLIKKELLNG